MEHSNKSTTMATSTLTSPAMSPLPSPLLLPQSPRGAPLANSSQQQIFNINNSSSNNKHAQQVNGGFSFYQSPQSHQFSHSSNMFGHSTHAYPSSTRPFADDSSNINNSTINQNNEHHNGSPGKLLPSTSNISLLSLSFAGASLNDHEATMDPLREEESKDSTNTSPLSPKQNQQQQQQQQQVPSQWFKSSNSLSSSFNSPGPYISTAHQRRVSHYRNSMSSTNLMGQASPSLSRHGSSNWGHISGLGNNSSNSANSGNFNSNVLGGVSVGSQAIPQASKPRRPSSSSYMPTSIAGSSGMQSPMYPSSVSSSSNLQMHDEPYLAPISLANSPSTFFLAQTPPIVLSNFNSYTRSPIEPNNYIHGSNSPLGNSNAQTETTSVLNFEPEKKAHLSVFSLMGGEDNNNKYVPKKNTEGEEEKVKRSNISKNIEKERAAALAASRVGDNNSNTATSLTSSKPDTAKKSGVGNDTTPKTIPEVAPVAAITPSNVMNLNANKNLASSSIFSTLAKANDNVINTTTSKKPTSIVNLSRDPPPLRSLQDNNNNNNNNNAGNSTIETSLEKSTNTQDFLNNFNKMDNKNFNRDSTQSTSNIEDRQKREQLKVSKTAAAITAALETEIFKNKDKQGTKYDIVKEDIPQHLMGKVLGSGSYPINIPTNNQKLDSNNSTKTTANEDSSDCKNRTDTLDDNSTKISINNCNVNNENNNKNNNDDDNSSSRNNNVQNSTQQPSTPPSSSSHYLKGSRMTPIQSSLSASISNLRGLASPNTTTMSSSSSNSNNNNSGSLASSSAAAQAARRRKSSLSLVHQGLVMTTSSTNSIPITTGTSGSSSNMSPYSEGYTYRRPPSSSNLSQLQEGIPMPGSSAGSSTSLSSINRMVPDSPDLQPLSMTPLESGLMTPMALDMSMSRVGSYASVDNFFVNPQQVQQPVRVLEVLKQEKEEEDDEDKKKDQQEGEENEDNGSSSTTTIN